MAGEEGKGGQDSSLVFTKSIMEQIQKEDVMSMVLAQREMLMRYEKTNEMLLNFNMLSGSRYETTMQEFRKHTQLLYEMKKDLDAIFRRIRQVKGRLSTLHPAAFSACSDVYNVLEEGGTDKQGETTTDNPADLNTETSVTATCAITSPSSELAPGEKQTSPSSKLVPGDKQSVDTS